MSHLVFKDLGVRDADEHLVGCHQNAPRESRQFSVERLLRFLFARDQDVEILIRPRRDKTKRRPSRVVKRQNSLITNWIEIQTGLPPTARRKMNLGGETCVLSIA
jgi:hypothetical protein